MPVGVRCWGGGISKGCLTEYNEVTPSSSSRKAAQSVSTYPSNPQSGAVSTRNTEVDVEQGDRGMAEVAQGTPFPPQQGQYPGNVPPPQAAPGQYPGQQQGQYPGNVPPPQAAPGQYPGQQQGQYPPPGQQGQYQYPPPGQGPNVVYVQQTEDQAKNVGSMCMWLACLISTICFWPCTLCVGFYGLCCHQHKQAKRIKFVSWISIITFFVFVLLSVIVVAVVMTKCDWKQRNTVGGGTVAYCEWEG
uniref:Uncharacterized protein n=1 Tax=Chromera velia CCMP2878 TaxID=1169474 RepID=A0A0G4GC62_9ALVE|eukprot:Cvel_4462.t1-p1 / transcript=Cvel_4462.t1 / gene=Cvel_4462 / organism=Chromera_velia_CCMP2878 / gene_product=hypothetical protein / transcript_product=hypothetical protein / location=Cvel_scaffold195:25981-36192(+) / protein_length=245 / sequence_SO=supercontig / SO=protein_coding / is_pseudo=false